MGGRVGLLPHQYFFATQGLNAFDKHSNRSDGATSLPSPQVLFSGTVGWLGFVGDDFYLAMMSLEPIWPLFRGVDLPVYVKSSKIWAIWVLGALMKSERNFPVFKVFSRLLKWDGGFIDPTSMLKTTCHYPTTALRFFGLQLFWYILYIIFTWKKQVRTQFYIHKPTITCTAQIAVRWKAARDGIGLEFQQLARSLCSNKNGQVSGYIRFIL